MAIPQVLIFVSLDELRSYAQAVCQHLAGEYGIIDAAVRSASVPADRLAISTTAPTTRAQLYVVLGPSTSSTSLLETDSPYPIVTLKTNDPQETALSIAKCCSLASLELQNRVRRAVQAQRQARLIADAEWRTQSPRYSQAMERCYDGHHQITGDAIPLPGRQRGKVRDNYPLGGATSATQPPDQAATTAPAAESSTLAAGNSSSSPSLLAFVTTDRQSGFDRQLALVPFKGAVLNLTSAFWFAQTAHIIANHLVAVPHPYVSIVRRCQPFPIEFVVRSYMTGSTATSIWKHYQDGARTYCGHTLPEGMKKNEKLAENLLTPTTKEEHHDRPISLAEIVEEKWMTQADLDVCAQAALQIFAYGQQVAQDRGLILVDTKYEFGRDEATGQILLIDEVHTPDSSRYWLASTYQQRIAQGQEPDNIDKEFLRLWFRDHCDPYHDEVLPDAPRELVLELSRRYISLYEMITWQEFDFDAVAGEEDIAKAIRSYTS